MKMMNRLFIAPTAIFIWVLTSNIAHAEYYIVSNSPCPTFQCSQPAPVREVVYYPVYKKHHVHKYKKHRYYAPTRVKRSTANISVYYYWQVYPNPCPCGGYCGGCAQAYNPAPVVYNETYVTEDSDTCSSSLDRATADDNPSCTPDMNIDN